MKMEKARKVCYIAYKDYPGPNFDYPSKKLSKMGYDISFILLKKEGKTFFKISDERKVFKVDVLWCYYA